MLRELLNLFEKLNDVIEIEEDERLVVEESNVTFYELRNLMTLLFKNAKDKTTQTVCADILKMLTIMELRNKPVPTIQKLKTSSPKVFG